MVIYTALRALDVLQFEITRAASFLITCSVSHIYFFPKCFDHDTVCALFVTKSKFWHRTTSAMCNKLRIYYPTDEHRVKVTGLSVSIDVTDIVLYTDAYAVFFALRLLSGFFYKRGG